MITDVYVTYNDDKQIERIKGESFKNSPFFTFISEVDRKSKKQAFALKNHWAAFACPFAVVMDKEKPVKAFYSEAENVVESLIKYLHENLGS